MRIAALLSLLVVVSGCRLHDRFTGSSDDMTMSTGGGDNDLAMSQSGDDLAMSQSGDDLAMQPVADLATTPPADIATPPDLTMPTFTLTVVYATAPTCVAGSATVSTDKPGFTNCVLDASGSHNSCSAVFQVNTSVTVNAQNGTQTNLGNPPFGAGQCDSSGCTLAGQQCQCNVTMTGNRTVTLEVCGLIG